MNEKQDLRNINWASLAQAISNDECILVLGPNIATIEHDGKQITLQQLLSNYLSKELLKINPNAPILSNSDLAYIAKQLEDALLPNCNFKEGRARARLGELIQTFYEQYDFSQFSVYGALAKLPFRFVLNTNPDQFLLDAYLDENKFSAVSEFYHYRNPSHNNNIITNQEFITPDAPLIFNLFGSVDDASSLIITESDRLTFLDTILQQENKAGIPNNIAMEFTSSKEKNFEKTFTFLGFDFNQWHLRLIMHIINRFQKQKETYALQNPQSLSQLTSFFYKRNFEVNFIDFSPQQFAVTFLEKIQGQKESSVEESPKLKAFLIFDEKDQAVKDDLDKQLAPLKRNEFIQTWDEEQIVGGFERDEEIKEKLHQADIILLLITPHFFNSDEIYEKQLQSALVRHQDKKAVVIPILIKSCVWQNSIIGKLPTILPRNRKALNEQQDEASALADTIQQLEGWCEKIYQRKKRK